VQIYHSIPDGSISQTSVSLTKDRQALLKVLLPKVNAYREKAKSFAAKNMHKEMLATLSEALIIADDTDAEAIQAEMFNVVKKNPHLAKAPDDAREHALRGEMLIKEGKFSEAVTEFKKAIRIAPYIATLYYNAALINAVLKNYPEAIRNMKMYIKADPDAPDVRTAKDEISKWQFEMEKSS
jgi:tetratricopeptide (TPR) repeat protein